MKDLDPKIAKISYSPRPTGISRFTYEEDKNILLKDNCTLFEDKLKYPSKFLENFKVFVSTRSGHFFDFSIIGKKTNTGEICYKWNHADILGPLQILACCSRDDRRIILPSGIHDYMLEFKYEVLEHIQSTFYPDMTMEEYRRLTSEIFYYACVSQGFSKFHAGCLATFVHGLQACFRKNKWKYPV